MEKLRKYLMITFTVIFLSFALVSIKFNAETIIQQDLNKEYSYLR